MAKIGALKLVTKASLGSVMIVRDRFASPVNGEFPPLLAADGSPATLTLMGADSPTARRLGYQRAAQAQNRLYASAFGKKDATVVITPDDVAEQALFDIERLVALTIDWHGFEDDDDQPIAFDPALVRELYEQNPDIREQALAFVEDRSAFFGRSSTPSGASSPTSSD